MRMSGRKDGVGVEVKLSSYDLLLDELVFST